MREFPKLRYSLTCAQLHTTCVDIISCDWFRSVWWLQKLFNDENFPNYAINEWVGSILLICIVDISIVQTSASDVCSLFCILSMHYSNSGNFRDC